MESWSWYLTVFRRTSGLRAWAMETDGLPMTSNSALTLLDL